MIHLSPPLSPCISTLRLIKVPLPFIEPFFHIPLDHGLLSQDSQTLNSCIFVQNADPSPTPGLIVFGPK